jgi:hypothetical protein
MSAKQGGSFATLLLAIPLSAIPLMAVFGIPEFTTLSAATQETLPPDLVRGPVASFEMPALPPETADQRHRRAAADLLSPADEAAQSSAAEKATWSSGPARASAAADSKAAPPAQLSPRPMQTAAPIHLIRPLPSAETTPAPAATASGLTWREATRRLEEIGITDYRLDRSETPDRFLFVCRFSPGTDDRIIQRFEAEAVEPLEAVERVLEQVELWLQHRFADSRRWLP